MAQAVRVVTVERGIDPRELALVPFGGAGPLHAAQIADELGMRRVLVPVASGVLSAFGLVVAERRRDLVESVLLDRRRADAEAIAAVVERLAERGREELREAARRRAGAARQLRPPLRGPGVRAADRGRPAPDPEELRRAFDRAHEERYGYADAEAEPRAGERARGGGAAGRRAAPGRLGRPAGRRASRGPPWCACPARRSWCPRAGAPAPRTTLVVMER